MLNTLVFEHAVVVLATARWFYSAGFLLVQLVDESRLHDLWLLRRSSGPDRLASSIDCRVLLIVVSILLLVVRGLSVLTRPF